MTATATATTATSAALQPRKPMMEIEPGIKIAAQVSPEASDDQLRFVQRLGVSYVTLWTDSAHCNADYYRSRVERFAQFGLRIYGMGNRDVHNQDAIVLNLPGRDAKVEEYKRHLRALGAAGIPYTTYAHMANGIWSTARETTRGGASARAFDLARAEAGHWNGVAYRLPLTNGREYTEEELWDNFAAFMRDVVPVAEEAGVRIGIHPDDPPISPLGGVPRIFSSFQGYVRALDIAGSPNVGLCLCAGCWLEGGDGMGKSLLDAIRYFGERGRIYKVHFRNVSAPLPHFVETFVDDGYMDMYQVMKALRDIDFRGILIPDHIPQMADDPRVGTAYSIAYMKALLHCALDEAAQASRDGSGSAGGR